MPISRIPTPTLTTQTTFSTDDSFRINAAINEILGTYGDTVSVESRAKSLLKFGRNNLVATTGSTIMTLPSGINSETYVSSNAIDRISSSSGSDTQIVTIEGHTISGSNLTFVTQNATLNGQNKVTLTTPLARCTRIFNTGSTSLVGTIYAYEDTTISSGAPTDGTKVHCMIRAGKNQSEKASTSLSSQDYWLVTQVYADVLEKSGTILMDIEIQMREVGKVFRQVASFSASTNARGNIQFDPYLIVPKNYDIRLQATSSAASKIVSGGIQGYLAIVT